MVCCEISRPPIVYPVPPMRLLSTLLAAGAALLCCPRAQAQKAPYDVYPAIAAPYFKVRFEGSSKPGELPYPVQYTLWLPPEVKTLRGVIVHQHGCGEGSCKSGLTGAFDLHWQALARENDCALISPAYEQPDKADCQLWCDPRNGSAEAFKRGLKELGKQCGHPELETVPWALWGHSGGGHWAGGMVLTHPQRVAAAWLRSGVPLLKADDKRSTIKVHQVPEAALQVPIMCNPGTKEGVSVKDGRFAMVWPANEAFFTAMRSKGALIGVAIDPLTAHECGNQRYLAIAWLNACLKQRLPAKAGDDKLQPMPQQGAQLAPLMGQQALPAAEYKGDAKQAIWLPDAATAKSWQEYVRDTAVSDHSPPPAPTDLEVQGRQLKWKARADLESGLAHFIILRDGQPIATVPEKPSNPFGRPIFQGLQYSDTPIQPLVKMEFEDKDASAGQHRYDVVSVNSAGLRSDDP
jgi:hypothetical protein